MSSTVAGPSCPARCCLRPGTFDHKEVTTGTEPQAHWPHSSSRHSEAADLKRNSLALEPSWDILRAGVQSRGRGAGPVTGAQPAGRGRRPVRPDVTPLQNSWPCPTPEAWPGLRSLFGGTPGTQQLSCEPAVTPRRVGGGRSSDLCERRAGDEGLRDSKFSGAASCPSNW